MMKKKIAIVSPNKNIYSESFIEAHKNFLIGEKHYLYGDLIPGFSDLKGSLKQYYFRNNSKEKIAKLLPVFIYNRIIKPKKEIDYLRFYLKNERIKSVLAEYGTTGAKIAAVCEELNIDLIVHFHGYDASKYEVLEANENAYRIMFNTAKTIIVVSDKMFEQIKGLGCPPKKIIKNTYGPRNEFFSIERTNVQKHFIGLGRFVDKKAPYYTILAFREVLKEHPEAKLTIGGDGPLLNSCRNLVRFLDMESSVLLPGVLLRENFIDLLTDSIAFVQHSIIAEDGDMEGTPVAILEASAAGLPVIATYHAGIPDVIEHGKHGFLVSEHDIESMAKYMNQLLDDIEMSKKMGSNARTNILENYTIERHIKVIQDLL
ncbi:glycosyltransferase [Robertkochia solimangrovi]|uniref:glycosyltransferase n=1 Tax=Robertkochia solimangrovi TaxID=2213046 RepID=UPI001180B7EC|nr:glycosyltransferase [Robertkochia solimangrovi]TRZ44977.1 hypothetical protein DMZ48_04240 [Robertkochia solimangrovi]